MLVYCPVSSISLRLRDSVVNKSPLCLNKLDVF